MDKLKSNNNNQLDRLTNEEFLNYFSVPECQNQFRNVKNIKSAVEQKIFSLAQIKKAYSENFVVAYIETWLYNLNDFLNLTRKFNKNQITETAYFIYSDFHYLKLSEVYFVFTKLKKGTMGNYYQSIDGTIVYAYFKDYAKERAAFFIEHDRSNIDNKISIKARADIIWKNYNNSEALQELYEKFKKP